MNEVAAQDARAQQIGHLRNFQGFTQHSPHIFDVNLPLSNGKSMLRITVPPNFPLSPPQLSTLHPISHPSVDSNTMIITVPQLQTWRPESNMYTIVAQVLRSLQSGTLLTSQPETNRSPATSTGLSPLPNANTLPAMTGTDFPAYARELDAWKAATAVLEERQAKVLMGVEECSQLCEKVKELRRQAMQLEIEARKMEKSVSSSSSAKVGDELVDALCDELQAFDAEIEEMSMDLAGDCTEAVVELQRVMQQREIIKLKLTAYQATNHKR